MGLPKIGDKKRFIPAAFCGQGGLGNPIEKWVIGTVVYVHPEGRYYMVEVDVNGHKWRQCFCRYD